MTYSCTQERSPLFDYLSLIEAILFNMENRCCNCKLTEVTAMT